MYNNQVGEKFGRVLFIAHDAARSGAPVLLLHFLRWLKETGGMLNFDVLILKDGPLREQFESLTTTFVVPKEYRYNLLNKIKVRMNPELCDDYRITEVVKKLTRNNYSLIYGNTIVSLPYLIEFKRRLNAKTVCAVHELSNAIAFFFDKTYVSAMLPQIDLIIGGSYAVSDNLKANYNIPADRIKVFHSFIDRNFFISKDKLSLKRDLGIKNDEIVIGGMSQIELRKGIDLIVPLAVALKTKFPEVKFKIVWVGGHNSDNFIQIVKQDAVKCGVANEILFVEKTAYPDDYINLYDIFLLLSREDPFPLVLLSAANMSKGIVAFQNSGGAAELLEDGAGFMAPYLNINAMSEIIADLYHQPHKIRAAGQKAFKKNVEEFNAEIISSQILQTLMSLNMN